MFIITHWDLLKHLTAKEIKARYKQSFLGFFWIILNPFFQMLIMSFVFSNIMKVKDLGVPYPVFIYAGLLPWIFFATSLGATMGVLIENSSLIKKIYFPREVLILSVLCAKAFDFFLSFFILLGLMVFMKIKLSLFIFLVIPVFIIQFMFMFGLSLLLSMMNLFYRDVQYFFNLILTLWFYLTPVLYAVEFFPEEYRWIFKMNPMAVFINAYRNILFNADWPNFGSLAVGVGISLFLFAFAYTLFKKMEGVFGDIV